MVKKIITTAIVIASLLSIVLAAVPRPKTEPETSKDTDKQKLQIISATEERLEFNFFSSTSGIHVLSVVHNNGESVNLSISSMSGEVIFAVDHPIDSSQNLMTIDGNEFLILNETLDTGETKMTEYIVQKDLSLQVKNGLKQHKLPKSLMQQLDHENAKSYGRSCIENLLIRPEVQLIEPAAFALGNNGVFGYNSSAAMVFYTTAMRFSSALNGHVTNQRDMEEPVYRNKRFLDDLIDDIIDLILPDSGNYCSNSDSNCEDCPRGPECLGLCGPGCTCWFWICLDCCYNSGCYTHDVEFCSGGTNSLLCWVTAPIGFICS